ncbi:MAG: hypothetical protein Roseis2KO_33380 [Roseivirga sp.]
MPVNRNALIRYKTIDNCLKNRFRKWTLEDLIEVCSETLYEYEGIDKGVSRRTVQMDIQMMRSDKLGYNAPIIVVDRKYYTYEDPEYSITNIPLTDQDLGRLSETVDFLKQFKGFSHFRELESMVQKLEDHVYSQKTHQKPVIDFEKNENLRGLEHLDKLYQTIIRKQSIRMTYQSFKARQANTFTFHPFLLKEFRNRWFVIGKRKASEEFQNLALDRIISLETSEVPLIDTSNFDADQHFRDVIGVSVSSGLEAEEVLLYVTHKHGPYVLTKPLHHSQRFIEKDNYGITISLHVQHNFELEKEILAFGDGVKVISPERLKRSIKGRLLGGVDLYNTELSESGLVTAKRRLEYNGSSVMNYVYTKREVDKLRRILDQHLPQSRSGFAQRHLMKTIPELEDLLFNKNLKRIVQAMDEQAFLTKAVFFNKPPDANWYVTWHQDRAINVQEKIETVGFTGWTQKDEVTSTLPPAEVNHNCFSIRIHLDDTTEANGALKVLPGSHKKLLTKEEIQLISTNSVPVITDMMAGGIHLMKPLLLHASAKSKSQKQRRVIHLEFASMELPGELQWAERIDLDLRPVSPDS